MKVSLFFVFFPLLASVYNSWSQHNCHHGTGVPYLESYALRLILPICVSILVGGLSLQAICFDLAIVNSISFFNYHFIYTRDEAEMEYLKIAQDLEMYGVSYFEIKVL